MRIEAVTAELRPRSEWEAVDLGLALVRRDFRRLLGAWWLGMMPAVAAGAALWWLHPLWAVLFFWWWVPVGSRLVLFRLSRTLFGDRPGWRDLLRELPRAMTRRFAYRMLWARMSPWRPLTMAVEDLEGLRGSNYRLRCRTLMRRGDSSLVLLFFWRLGLLAWLMVALVSTVAVFLSQTAQAEWGEAIEAWFGETSYPVPAGFAFVWLMAALVAMCLTDLFATGAGFAIYVNHRTWIEGWDVELAFRRISARLAKVAVAVVLAFSGIDRGLAQEPEDVIGQVLSHPDFEVHEKTTKEPVPWDWWERLWDGFGSGGSGAGAGVISSIGWVLLVCTIVLALAALVWLLVRFLHVVKPREGSRIPGAAPQARVVMGMEVTHGSLPEDVAAVALAAWHAGRRHEALALLYRGAISWMIRVPRVEIAESDTEMDCLRRVHGASLVEAGYFEQLTQVWSRLAYARVEPGDEVVESLCARWPFGKGGGA